MKRFVSMISIIIVSIALVACEKPTSIDENIKLQEQEIISSTAIEQISTHMDEETSINNKPESSSMKIKVMVGDYIFTATLEDNEAVRELMNLMKEGPIVLNLDDYSGFEKVGELGRSLTRSDKKITTESGDIVLYNGSNIVIFYGSNTWSYTRLGKIDDLSNWDKALGSEGVTVTFCLGE